MSDGDSLKNWLNEYGKDSYISVTFHLAIRLIGGAGGNQERFKFWLDDVRIECTYEFIEDPTADVPSTVSIHERPDQKATARFRIKNKGVESFDWKITDVEPISGYGLQIPDKPTFNKEKGDNLDYFSTTNGGSGQLITMSLPANKGKHNTKTYKWQLTVKADYDNDGKYDDFARTVTITFDYGTMPHSKTISLYNLLQVQFPHLFALLQRLTVS